MVFQVRQRLRHPPALQVFGRRTQHPPVAHQFASQVLARQVITHADFQIEALADDVDHAIKHVQAQFKPGIGLRQLADRRCHMVAPETEAAADVQRTHRLLPRL
ncbi:hypothetical protein D9M69_528300 [compost metagenome]